jgi:hypothetical protein
MPQTVVPQRQKQPKTFKTKDQKHIKQQQENPPKIG